MSTQGRANRGFIRAPAGRGACGRGGWRYRGFSLVEVVVGVAVLAFLLSQVMVAAAGARKKSRAVSCLDKLAQLGRASMIYASRDPHENSIPVSYTAAVYGTTRYTRYLFGGKAGAGGTGAYAGLNSLWGDRFVAGPASRPMNAVLYKTRFRVLGRFDGDAIFKLYTEQRLDAYHCPEDSGFPGMHIQGWKTNGISSYDYFGTSYACNPLWIFDPLDPGRLFSNSMYQRPLSLVPNPGNTIMYWENAARFAMFADNPEDYGPPGNTPPAQPPLSCRHYFTDANGFVAHGWHGQDWQFNVAFGDGHADTVFIRSYPITFPPDPPVECWSGDDPAARCICFFVRGSGWQMDTMPAPLIKSNYPAYGGPEVPEGSADGASDEAVVP